MNIDGVEYQPVDKQLERLQIVCCHRGFVFVGKVTDVDETEVVIRDSSCIRRWGTTSGLGQLATEGPQKNTSLDPSGTVRVHPLSIVFRMDCEAAKW